MKNNNLVVISTLGHIPHALAMINCRKLDKRHVTFGIIQGDSKQKLRYKNFLRELGFTNFLELPIIEDIGFREKCWEVEISNMFDSISMSIYLDFYYSLYNVARKKGLRVDLYEEGQGTYLYAKDFSVKSDFIWELDYITCSLGTIGKFISSNIKDIANSRSKSIKILIDQYKGFEKLNKRHLPFHISIKMKYRGIPSRYRFILGRAKRFDNVYVSFPNKLNDAFEYKKIVKTDLRLAYRLPESLVDKVLATNYSSLNKMSLIYISQGEIFDDEKVEADFINSLIDRYPDYKVYLKLHPKENTPPCWVKDYLSSKVEVLCPSVDVPMESILTIRNVGYLVAPFSSTLSYGPLVNRTVKSVCIGRELIDIAKKKSNSNNLVSYLEYHTSLTEYLINDEA